jgi:hypothetical protein
MFNKSYSAGARNVVFQKIVAEVVVKSAPCMIFQHYQELATKE